MNEFCGFSFLFIFELKLLLCLFCYYTWLHCFNKNSYQTGIHGIYTGGSKPYSCLFIYFSFYTFCALNTCLAFPEILAVALTIFGKFANACQLHWKNVCIEFQKLAIWATGKHLITEWIKWIKFYVMFWRFLTLYCTLD